MKILVIQKKYLVLLLVLLFAVQIALTFVACTKTMSQKTSIINYTIVIDAGHGGKDCGVVAADGTKESDLNLAYSKTLGNLLENAGFNVVHTRKTKDGLYGLPTRGFKLRDMQARKKIIDNSCANLVLSLHMNKYSQSYRNGPQVFYQSGGSGQILAQTLQKVFNDFSGNSHHQAQQGDYYICREVDCPSVIVECGFLSNEQDLANLKSESYRQLLCEKIFGGVMLYLCG